MHKQELVEAVAGGTSGSAGDPLTKADVEQVIDELLEVVEHELAQGGEVRLTGFGTFSTSERNPTNPQTGQKLGSRYVPTFKAGKGLKDAVMRRPVS